MGWFPRSLALNPGLPREAGTAMYHARPLANVVSKAGCRVARTGRSPLSIVPGTITGQISTNRHLAGWENVGSLPHSKVPVPTLSAASSRSQAEGSSGQKF